MAEVLDFTGAPDVRLYYRCDGSRERPLAYSPQFEPNSQEAQMIVGAIEEGIAAWRQEVADTLPHTTAQMDTERPVHFLHALDLPVAPAQIVPDMSYATLPGEDQLSEGDVAVFNQWLRLAFVTNVPDLENRDDILVHELAHGSGIKVARFILEHGEIRGYAPARLGFLVSSVTLDGEYRPHLGKFAEEGFSDLARAAYKRITATEGNEPDGPIPTRYIHTDESTGSPLYGDWAHAGITLELLADKDPAIMDDLFASRTSLSGLRRFAHRVNTLSPGLYDKLRHAHVDPENNAFREVLEDVVKTLYPRKSLEDVCLASGEATQAYIDPLMRAYEQENNYRFAHSVKNSLHTLDSRD